MRPEAAGATVTGIQSVLVFSSDPVENAHWWAAMWGGLPVRRLPAFAIVVIGGIEVCFRPPDYRNPPGGSPCVYWRVESFNQTRYHLKDWSCIELHYPIIWPDGTQITAFRDPFGVTFGIQGTAGPDEPIWPDRDLNSGRIPF